LTSCSLVQSVNVISRATQYFIEAKFPRRLKRHGDRPLYVLDLDPRFRRIFRRVLKTAKSDC